MAFIVESTNVISFAEYQDVLDQDSRLFESNESLTDDIVEDALIRTTQVILSRIKTTDWWQGLYSTHNSGVHRLDIPNPNPNRIQARQDDFTDLCVFTALAERILPSIADFGDEDSAERRKMGYYENRATELYMELIRAGDWYDFDGDDTVQTDEKRTGNLRLMRVR